MKRTLIAPLNPAGVVIRAALLLLIHMKPKILITRQVFPEIIAALSQQFEVDHNESDDIFSADVLRTRAQRCAGVIACLTEKIDAAFFDACRL